MSTRHWKAVSTKRNRSRKRRTRTCGAEVGGAAALRRNLQPNPTYPSNPSKRRLESQVRRKPVFFPSFGLAVHGCRSENVPEQAALAYGLPLLKLLLWTVLMALAVEIEFGFVFVALTLFYVVLTNLRDGRRAAGEPSAYSVFNADCRPLDGELRAEMFERTLRGGGL